VVAALGPGVHDLAPGDHVVLVFVPSCGACRPCAEGRPALCEPAARASGAGELLGGGRRLRRADGGPVHHHLGVSCFADHAVVSRRSLVKIDPAIPLEQAALFGCAVQTGVGAAVNTAPVAPGTQVAVIGLGGVGLNALLAAKVSGAARIVAVDLLDDKLALARQLGATDAVNAGAPDAAEQVRELSAGGVDIAFEMAGAVPALELAYRVTRRGGTTVTAGLAHPDARLAIPAVSLVAEERTLKGSYIGSCVPPRDIPRYLTLFQQGQLPVDRLLSERLTLDQLNAGFDRLADGTAVRQVLVFD
jgi:alcohol dehydrogenase